MEEFVLNQIKYGLKYVPVNLAKSFFIKKSRRALSAESAITAETNKS